MRPTGRELDHPGADIDRVQPTIREPVPQRRNGGERVSRTCRMGADDEAIVGPDLRVKGIENLWIADASIMPNLISGNTNAACMMIGTKLGRELAIGP